MKQQGWLLDASIDRERRAFTLWIRSDGKTHGFTYRAFQPSLFLAMDQPENRERPKEETLNSVREHAAVTEATVVDKYVSVYDLEKRPVIQAFTTPESLQEVAQGLEQLPGITVFHADIDSVQQLLIAQDLIPFGRVEFDLIGDEIVRIASLDRREDTEYEVPELNEMRFEVYVDTKNLFPKTEDPVHHIDVHHRGMTIRVQGSTERETLLEFQRTIDEIDPDVVVTRGGDDHLFRYLTLRCKANGVRLVLSRDGEPLNVVDREHSSFWQYNQIVFRAGNQVMFNGRIHIDRSESLYYSPSGMEGVIEGCRLALAQPQKVARMSIGSVNAAVQYYTACKRDLLIPPVKRNPEFLKSIGQLATVDRGGLILQPRPDIYENIGECDFSSMYPTLMVTRNISPETICMRTQCPYDHAYCIDVPDLHFRICNRRRGIVAESLELIVKKRSAFKRLIQRGRDVDRYELMQNTLKGILVSCFGYLGFKNARFGRVEAHTAVTAFARETLLKTQAIAERRGLEMIHGIVDSLWVRSETNMEYENLLEFCRLVTEAVGIDMSLKGVYRWMVIPSSRLHPSIAPLNRYYGVYQNGAIKTRGIETRRRDTCLYVGDCQKEMIKTLARARDKDEFIAMIPNAWTVCDDFVRRLRQRDVDVRDLVLHTRMTRDPDQYHSTSRAAVVSQQLAKAGRELYAGQKVRYLMVEAESENPLRRVRALELLDDTTNYDPQAYSGLCIRAFESLIPVQYIEPAQLSSYIPTAQPVRISQ